ncbi:zinc knuckle CX2CX4HX4C containing protein [Tanacetum coccineum]
MPVLRALMRDSFLASRVSFRSRVSSFLVCPNRFAPILYLVITGGCESMSSKDSDAGNSADKIKNIADNFGTFMASLDGGIREKEVPSKEDLKEANTSNKDISGQKKDGGIGSFASLLKNPNIPVATKAVCLSVMQNNESVQGSNVAISLAAVEEISNHFENTLYGYFIGKRLAFPLVENYVNNAWAKFGLKRLMIKKGFFFFQFETREGMERVLENGPWLILLAPIILNIWMPNTRLTKDTITSAPIWVKIHNVPIVAYSEFDLSLITS